MREHRRTTVVGLVIAALLLMAIAPAAQAIQPVRTQQDQEETQPQRITPAGKIFSYLLSWLSIFDRNNSTVPDKDGSGSGSSTGPLPLPDPTPQTTSSDDDGGEGGSTWDPNS